MNEWLSKLLKTPVFWRAVFMGAMTLWALTITLFAVGFSAYPVGWLLLLVVAAWAWYAGRRIN